MEYKEVALDDLKPAPYNPRKISPQALKGLVESIKRFGLVQPILVNKRTGLVVGGHQRIEAMKKAAMTTAQVGYVDLSDDEETALNIALNSPAISGQFTDDLQGLLDGLREELPHEFVDLRFDDLIKDITATGGGDPDEAPAVEKTTESKLGDMWELGEHRLLCGDSSQPSVYSLLLLPDELIDCCFTDPPYGVDYGEKNRFLNSFQPSGRNLKDIANDMIGKDDLLKMLVSAFSAARNVSADHCSYYVTAPQGGELGLMMMMMMSDLPTRHILIWAKNSQNFSLGRLDYEYQHEPILYTWKKTHKFYGGGGHRSSLWQIDKPRQSVDHPTMKPVELIQNAVLNSSQRGDLVLDMFAGSGSTLIACERTQRRARCIEIDPAYCDVIVSRWERFTGQKAVKLDGK